MTWFSRWGLLVAVACVLTHSGQSAAFSVFDYSRFVAMYQQLQEVGRLVTQVRTSERLIRNSATRLRSGQILQDPLYGIQRLAADVRIIGYRFDTISQQYHHLFPDEQAVRNTTPEEVQLMASSWDTEIQQSALVAARAQTTVSQLDSSARASEALLAAAQNATEDDQGSKLAALQALVKMLAVVNDDLGRLGSVLASTERVNAALAATEGASERAVEERHRRLKESYLEGTGSVPEVDRRFLGSGR